MCACLDCCFTAALGNYNRADYTDSEFLQKQRRWQGICLQGDFFLSAESDIAQIHAADYTILFFFISAEADIAQINAADYTTLK